MRRLRAAPIAAAVKLGCDHPWLTVLVSLLLSVAAMWFVAGHFRMTSDTAQLISDKVDWRRHEIAMAAAFPQNNDTSVVVVDGATPELAEDAATRLAAAMAADTRHFRLVQRPDGG
ncbi:MAG TPA: hypothetical protein VGN89_15295, partial [Phenylobacterium sp.]|nr:hypothetical protein [Phenylobacterium sp.]